MLRDLGNGKAILEFEDWERESRYNWMDFAELGDFIASYLILNVEGMTDDDTINEFEAVGYLTTPDDQVKKISLSVLIDWNVTAWIPVKLGELKSGEASAFDIYRTVWDYFEFVEIDKVEPNKNLRSWDILYCPGFSFFLLLQTFYKVYLP